MLKNVFRDFNAVRFSQRGRKLRDVSVLTRRSSGGYVDMWIRDPKTGHNIWIEISPEDFASITQEH